MSTVSARFARMNIDPRAPERARRNLAPRLEARGVNRQVRASSVSLASLMGADTWYRSLSPRAPCRSDGYGANRVHARAAVSLFGLLRLQISP